MKTLFLTLLLLAVSTFALAQNLVPNSSFEEYNDTCLANVDVAYLTLKNWKSARLSPDYFNRNCNTVPSDIVHGYQEAATGNAYTGIVTYCSEVDCQGGSYKEIMISELTEPMVVNQTYYISFKANLSLTSDGFTCATNKIGILLSTVSYDRFTNEVPLLNQAHLYTNQIITDTLGWTLISGKIVSDSAYKYILLGNLFDDEHTDSLVIDSTICASYYFIDDVCISIDSTICTNSVIRDKFTDTKSINIYPNPSNGEFIINTVSRNNIKMYDLLGRSISFKSLKSEQNKIKIDISDKPTGVYLLTVFNNSTLTTFKIQKN